MNPTLLCGLLLCIGGCGIVDDVRACPVVGSGQSGYEQKPMVASATYADYLLSRDDYQQFRPGRSKDDILKDVQWRGNFEMATEYKGKIVSAISFGLVGGPYSSDGGDIVWAIFADDKFQKFVRWPAWGEKPIKVGDFRRLFRAVENEPVRISDIEKEVKAKPSPPPQTDVGLTLAWLALRPAIEVARKRALKRNAELREQFNASRLRIGMTAAEVQSVLRADPIATGDVEAGPFKLYGSTESVDVLPYLHYSNILVVFREGKVSGIYSGYSVPGGEQGLGELRKSFVDLPLAKASAQSPVKPAAAKGKAPKNETVMSPTMKIQATTPDGKMVITAVDDLTRSYTWEGATRSVEMLARGERWYGSLGLYYPGPGDHWKEHKGITRGVTEEGQQHFKSAEEALKWLRSRTWMPYVYRDDGLVVGWNKTLPRKQLDVEVWQILVNGKKPSRLPGSQNDKIVVTHVELWSSPLGKAVQKKDVRAVMDLLAEGADPNAKNIVGRPVLVEAATRSCHEIVGVLLQKGADPNARSEDGSTALLKAVGLGDVETVKVLAAGGADVNATVERGLLKGMTPLMMAALEHAEIVQVLLAKGADVNAKTETGLTALSLARQSKRQDIVRLLKAAGAKD